MFKCAPSDLRHSLLWRVEPPNPLTEGFVRSSCAPRVHGAQGAFSKLLDQNPLTLRVWKFYFSLSSYPFTTLGIIRILTETSKSQSSESACVSCPSNVWLLYRWITPLLRRGLNKKLELTDVYKAPSFDLADTLSERLERFVSREVVGWPRMT